MQKLITCSFVDAEQGAIKIQEVISPSEPGVYLVEVKCTYLHSNNGQQLFAALHYGDGQNLSDRSDPFRIDANNTILSAFDLEHPDPGTAALYATFTNLYYVNNTSGLFLVHNRGFGTPTLLTETLNYRFQISKIG